MASINQVCSRFGEIAFSLREDLGHDLQAFVKIRRVFLEERQFDRSKMGGARAPGCLGNPERAVHSRPETERRRVVIVKARIT